MIISGGQIITLISTFSLFLFHYELVLNFLWSSKDFQNGFDLLSFVERGTDISFPCTRRRRRIWTTGTSGRQYIEGRRRYKQYCPLAEVTTKPPPPVYFFVNLSPKTFSQQKKRKKEKKTGSLQPPTWHFFLLTSSLRMTGPGRSFITIDLSSFRLISAGFSS